MIAISAQAVIDRQVPNAAAQTPQRKMKMKRNSRAAEREDMRTLSHMLLCVLPQILR